jgi:hypothetical protein
MKVLQRYKSIAKIGTTAACSGSVREASSRGQSQPHMERSVCRDRKIQKEAATLGRTTDLRIIAVTAIPRSTTELQQLVDDKTLKYEI